MDNSPLIEFIKKEIASGKDKETIKSLLLTEGNWSEEDLRSAFRKLNRINTRNEFLMDIGLFTLIPIIFIILVFIFIENYQENFGLLLVGFPACVILFFILRPFVHRVFLKKEIVYGKLLVPLSIFIGATSGYFIGIYSNSMYMFLGGSTVGTLVGFIIGNWFSTRFLKKKQVEVTR